MPTVTRAANAHTTVVTGWTNPSNAYQTTGDNIYATAKAAAAATISGDFGFPDVGAYDPWTSNALRDGSTVSVAYGNGYWVTVGAGGMLSYTTSPNGTWTNNDQGFSDFYGVAYGNGYWVAVGITGTLYYKATDPTGAWTSNTQGSSDLYAVAYADGYWVAVGITGKLWYKATDPTGAWTSNTSGSSDFYAVAYGNGYWVAVGSGGALYWSTTATGPVALPNNAQITAVRIIAEVGMDITGSTVGVQGRVSGANSGTETTKTTTTEEQITATLGTVTLADARSASAIIKGRLRITAP